MSKQHYCDICDIECDAEHKSFHELPLTKKKKRMGSIEFAVYSIVVMSIVLGVAIWYGGFWR